jgi:HAD superfamily hydrolase (TIGR01490 family)
MLAAFITLKRAFILTLAIFDLDNTLIGGDSDHAWGQFLVENNYVDTESYERQNDAFYEDYKAGTLDIIAYQEFAFAPLAQYSPDELASMHQQFIKTKIEPMLLDKAAALIQHHRDSGHQLLIITATNRFITQPIATLLGFDQLIATEGEMIDGKYTGKVSGVPSFAEGKITRLNQWLAAREESLEGSFFYSDSHNDLPLLETVSHPIAVDPDPTLERIAKERDWRVISLR